MEKRTLSLLKSKIETEILDSSTSEKAKYLDVSQDFQAIDLEQDIELGASQFTNLKKLVNMESEPRYILISTDNLEQGYLAVMYLASAFQKKHEKEGREQYPLMNASSWEESTDKIPIIHEYEIRDYMNDDYEIPFGNMLGMKNSSNIKKQPYWMDCTNYSVCIVATGNLCACGGGGYGTPFYNGLELFKKNDKVYLINLLVENSFDDCWDDVDERNFFEPQTSERSEWNYIVLSFAVDEVDVLMNERVKKKYCRLLLDANIRERQMRVKKGFSYTKLIRQIVQMQDDNKCRLIESIINYALKDKKAGDNLLTNADFSFMERFITMPGQKKSRAVKNNAKQELMHSLIGMEDVKRQVLDVINVMKYNQIRTKMKIQGSTYHNVHMMLGAPGTAKTTVAKLMGEIMMQEKLLPDCRFIYINGAELKGMYVGHSAPKTKAIFDNNDIIVIDEAYSLVDDKGECDSFSKEAIAQLIIELEDHATDKLVIFAGYGGKSVSERNNKMKAFLDSNPGIKSRITSTIFFDSYSPKEVTQIFFSIAKAQHYIVEKEAEKMILRYFEKRVHDSNFGNGREARSLLETAVVFAASRVFSEEKKHYSIEEMSKITCEDIQHAIQQISKTNTMDERGKKAVVGF